MMHGQRAMFEDRVRAQQSLDIGINSPESIGQHLLFKKERIGGQFKKKPKLIVPNCALIIP